MTFSARLTAVLVLLLLAFGLFVALVSRSVIAGHADEALQRQSRGLARHIVGHWPEITARNRDQAERQARDALLSMLMAVNPAVQVYVLDAEGRVDAYIGEPGMVRQFQVQLDPVRAFLGGAALPVRGTDPMGSPQPRLFSAAMFPPRPGDVRPPGYLYIVLNGGSEDAGGLRVDDGRVLRAAAVAGAAGLAATAALGLVSFAVLTLPLHRLARRMHGFDRRGTGPAHVRRGGEVATIERAFTGMTQRIDLHQQRERQQAAAHRETMAGIAHDLRTPLTALHGHLEVLAAQPPPEPPLHARLLAAALAQSDKVRRLSHQLFELAALQASAGIRRRDRFRIDELVTDAVHKFELMGTPARVRLGGAPPGPLEVVGDFGLVERALTNLIDIAVQHARAEAPVPVSLARHGPLAEIVVADAGPGLPEAFATQLRRGQPVRHPGARFEAGRIGGLGLAIAQRIAILHGGTLRPLAASRGARLCLAPPLAGA